MSGEGNYAGRRRTALQLAAAGCSLWLCALAAQAQSEGPVVAVPAENCQLVVSEPDINYGGLTRGRLESRGSSAQQLYLGKRTLVLNVNCREPVKIGIRLRAPTSGSDYAFGPQGKVTLRMEGAQLDGRSVLVGTASSAGMMPIAPATGALFVPGQVIVPVDGGEPAVGSRFSASIDMDPYVPQDAARVKSRTSFETNGSFEVIWR